MAERAEAQARTEKFKASKTLRRKAVRTISQQAGEIELQPLRIGDLVLYFSGKFLCCGPQKDLYFRKYK